MEKVTCPVCQCDIPVKIEENKIIETGTAKFSQNSNAFTIDSQAKKIESLQNDLSKMQTQHSELLEKHNTLKGGSHEPEKPDHGNGDGNGDGDDTEGDTGKHTGLRFPWCG